MNSMVVFFFATWLCQKVLTIAFRKFKWSTWHALLPNMISWFLSSAGLAFLNLVGYGKGIVAEWFVVGFVLILPFAMYPQTIWFIYDNIKAIAERNRALRKKECEPEMLNACFVIGGVLSILLYHTWFGSGVIDYYITLIKNNKYDVFTNWLDLFWINISLIATFFAPFIVASIIKTLFMEIQPLQESQKEIKNKKKKQ